MWGYLSSRWWKVSFALSLPASPFPSTSDWNASAEQTFLCTTGFSTFHCEERGAPHSPGKRHQWNSSSEFWKWKHERVPNSIKSQPVGVLAENSRRSRSRELLLLTVKGVGRKKKNKNKTVYLLRAVSGIYTRCSNSVLPRLLVSLCWHLHSGLLKTYFKISMYISL